MFAGWLAAAVLATLVGLTAVRFLGDSFTSGRPDALSAAEVARALAETDSSAGPSGVPSGPSAPAPSGGPTTRPGTPRGSVPVGRTFRTVGGVVRAECTGETVRLASWAPAAGYEVHKVDQGPRREADVEFRGDEGEVKVELSCARGTPVLRAD